MCHSKDCNFSFQGDEGPVEGLEQRSGMISFRCHKGHAGSSTENSYREAEAGTPVWRLLHECRRERMVAWTQVVAAEGKVV